MTVNEVSLCLIAVIASSFSQIFIKLAARQVNAIKMLLVLGGAGLLVFFSIIVSVWVLRTIQLSQLMPFATGAYILVPLGSKIFFNEKLQQKFWLGIILILTGVIIVHL